MRLFNIHVHRTTIKMFTNYYNKREYACVLFALLGNIFFSYFYTTSVFFLHPFLVNKDQTLQLQLKVVKCFVYITHIAPTI